MIMDLQPYLPDNRESCLAVFDSNTPRYFDLAEREEFESFLNQPNCSYFVMKHNDQIVGCGGYVIAEEGKLARLVWGMVRSDLHKNGLGRFLLMFRLREIAKHDGIQAVRLSTSQHAALFFEKQGFKVMGVIENGYAPGLNRIEMVKKLIVCA